MHTLLGCRGPSLAAQCQLPVPRQRARGRGDRRRIISNVAGLLNERGFCQLLTNWAHIEGIDWRKRVERAFAGCGCNAWALAVHHAEADVYASRWIQHLERTPDAVGDALDEWMRYYERERITGISWCVVTLRRATGPRTWFELDELPAGINAPVGDHLLRCFEARELLDGLGDDALLDLRPRVAPQTRLEQNFTPAPEGWAPGEAQLRLTGGLPLDLAVDSSVANLLVRSMAACHCASCWHALPQPRAHPPTPSPATAPPRRDI